jgi:hypothetical protein
MNEIEYIVISGLESDPDLLVSLTEVSEGEFVVGLRPFEEGIDHETVFVNLATLLDVLAFLKTQGRG